MTENMKDKPTGKERADTVCSPPFTYPSEEEMRTAQSVCCGRVCTLCESPAAYAWRKRDIDMSVLTETAVENDLTPAERQIVKLVYYENIPLSEAAEKLGVNRSTAQRNLRRGEQALERVLKYAVMYQRGVVEADAVPASLRRAVAVAAARHTSPESFAGTVKKYRTLSALSPEKLDEYAKLGAGRTAQLENGKNPHPAEIVKLAAFFGVSADRFLLCYAGSDKRQSDLPPGTGDEKEK